IRYSRAAQAAVADGIMVVHPYYCLPTEHELEANYRDLAHAIDLPIMIYNNPWTTGVDMKPAQLARVAEAEPYIRYVKESSGDAAPPTTAPGRDPTGATAGRDGAGARRGGHRLTIANRRCRKLTACRGDGACDAARQHS